MFTTADFLKYAQWSGIFTLICLIIAVLAFILQWGIRFRFVGITGFMLVLTAGLFSLGLVPLTRTQIPNAQHYSLIYDNGGPFAVISVSPKITSPQLEATLRQAANNLYSYGRYNPDNDQFTVRARTIVHPQNGVSQLLYLGEAKRSLSVRNDQQMTINVFSDKIALLPKN